MSEQINFYKYQGTGNDFVIIDNRDFSFIKDKGIIEKICHRRFGIGADGLILLEDDANSDFKMVYYNSDGNESTMCGNGGRCIVAFAKFLNIFNYKCNFSAIDGNHAAEISGDEVKLKMIDVYSIEYDAENFVLNTGSPHLVQYVQDLKDFDVYKKGSAVRNSEKYKKEGINVNFVQELNPAEIFVRTYERGVEDETLSCGTGATAAALTYMKRRNLANVSVKVLGGNLKIYAENKGSSFINIWLEGSAEQIFNGKISIK